MMGVGAGDQAARPAAGRVVGVIPARWGSTRLPGKSLVMLHGRPLIAWVVRQARRAATLDRVLVATDDARIADAARAAGGEAVMTRPDHPSGTDRIAEAVRDEAADLVVNIQGDEPLIEPALIDGLVGVLRADAACDVATAATPLADADDARKPSVVKVVCDFEGRALYFSRAAIPHVRDAGQSFDEPLYWRHMGVYAYRRVFLERMVRTPPSPLERAEALEQLRALQLGACIRVVRTEDPGIGVDTPEDVAYVEALMRARGLDREGA